MTTNDTRTHFAPYGSTNALCDETVPRSVGSEMPYGEYADQRFTVKRARTTCPDCRSRMAGAPDQDHARTARERAETIAIDKYPDKYKSTSTTNGWLQQAFIRGYLACHADMTARDALPLRNAQVEAVLAKLGSLEAMAQIEPDDDEYARGINMAASIIRRDIEEAGT